MRFKQLRGLTGLPIEAIRGAFHGEDVRTVLPVNEETRDADSVLVATTAALAIVTGESGEKGDRWLTRWVPWDVVRIDGPSRAVDGDRLILTVHVGPFRFVARLPGELGRQALHDFIRAAPAGTMLPAT